MHAGLPANVTMQYSTNVMYAIGFDTYVSQSKVRLKGSALTVFYVFVLLLESALEPPLRILLSRSVHKFLAKALKATTM